MVRGKFWPPVRALIWDKATQMFQEEQARTMGEDWKAITPERKELREKGLFQEAKILVLRELYYAKKEGSSNGAL
ncbi:hypothetical protein MUP79_06705 [Candidatus Bathyarchaeota archaeon]|nr:hypothetical protein [Candidatus Bathyarchaeota archaeon]